MQGDGEMEYADYQAECDAEGEARYYAEEAECESLQKANVSTCDDCGTTKGIVDEFCIDCMNKRSEEHIKYKLKQERK